VLRLINITWRGERVHRRSRFDAELAVTVQ
jgi:hypothetical protein